MEAVDLEVAGTTTEILSDATYHPDGTWSELAYGNGVTLTRTLDGFGRLTSIAVDGSTDDVTWTYGWDDAGNVTSIEDIDGTDTFTYDAVGRLTSAFYGDDGTEQTFRWDDAGNLVEIGGDYATFSTTYTYNHDDALSYDGVGNLLEDGVSAFTYDARGRMTDAVSSSRAVATTYDATGRRVLRAETNLRTRRSQETYYTYDAAGRLLATYGTVGGRAPPRLQALYVYAGAQAIAVWRPDRGAVYWLHTDALGTVRANSDAAGSVGGTAEYLPFGAERLRTGTLLAERDQAWAGHGAFDAMGVADFGARSYLEDLPRFVTPDRGDYGDPADPQSLNRYGYGRGGPLGHADRSGNIVETFWDVANLMMGAGSLGTNLAKGNWGGAAADAVGMAMDAAAVAVPGLPGGAGTAIKAARAANRVADVASGVRQAERIVEAAETAVQAERTLEGAVRATRAAEKAAEGVKAVEKVAERGKIVLGRFPEYIEMADRIGARRHNISCEGMCRDEMWEHNRRFLDEAIERGDEILLASPLSKATKDTFFAKEIAYLRDRGYSPSKDRLSMVRNP